MLLSPNILSYTASDLRYRAIVRHAVVQFDDNHNRIIMYSDNNTDAYWASVSAKTSVINFGANAYENRIVYEIVMRYGAQVNLDDEVICNGITMKLNSAPVDIEGRHKFIALECYAERQNVTTVKCNGDADCTKEIKAGHSRNADTSRNVIGG